MREWINLVESTTAWYHHSPSENRTSILRHGLRQDQSEAARTAKSMGMEGEGSGIYFARLPRPQNGIDIWKVDLNGLNIDSDDTTDPDLDDDEWVVCHDSDIEPERLTLIDAGGV